MALPTPTPSGPVALINPGFETGDATGWTLGPNTAIATDDVFAGTYSIKFTGTAGLTQTFQATTYPTYPGMPLTISVQYQQGAASSGHNTAKVGVKWYDSANQLISQVDGNTVTGGSGGAWNASNLSTVAPAGAAFFAIGITVNRTNGNPSWADNFTWNYAFSYSAVLDQPGIEYTNVDLVPIRITITKNGTANVTNVQYYYMTEVAGIFVDPTLIVTLTDAPYAYNAPAFANGTYGIYGVVSLDNGATITTNSRIFVVGAAPTPLTREYKASNSYTYLGGENILNLGAGLPSTAIVTGVEVELTYALQVLVRAKDKDVTDIDQFTPSVAFDVINDGVFETVLMSKSGGNYTILGSPDSVNIPIEQSAFTVTEQGVADGTHLWTVYSGASGTATVGGEEELFNLGSVPATDFLDYAFGVRFYPTVVAKPAYAADGDCVVRVFINAMKIRVYFDAGSVEYYFASADKTQVLKGTLVAYNVADGDFRNGDASGTLQLSPILELIDGTQTWIGDDWTIHSGYPVTDRNQIGEVAEPDASYQGHTIVGMKYNDLPGQDQVYNNRSRYVFITANFYGDLNLESIYGANGYGRGFAYNGRDFYKIYTQPEAEKDKPRHVAFHHTHLALGYGEGRVDISVVGEPFNFSGLDGASSWAIGDSVTGLLPLSGAILGVFCKKSIVGISGTTVDNFATQTLSPSLGAVEYTITNMGYPVYANAYGIYTLSQTQQYGDYLGTPLSQQVSPWLRPRLIRKYTSDKEVVVAWPVRSKNQYKLAFSDGYVLSMTMNYGQQSSPTFSKQKYFLRPDDVDVEVPDIYAQESLYPIAISSELDDSGEERIHVAHKIKEVPPDSTFIFMVNGQHGIEYPDPMPPWFVNADYQLEDPNNPGDPDFTIYMIWDDGLDLFSIDDPPGGDPNGQRILVQGPNSILAFVENILS